MSRVKWLLTGSKEEGVAREKGSDCVFCDAPLGSDALPDGGIRLILPVCREHTQAAAKRALARQVGKLLEAVREKLESE